MSRKAVQLLASPERRYLKKPDRRTGTVGTSCLPISVRIHRQTDRQTDNYERLCACLYFKSLKFMTFCDSP